MLDALLSNYWRPIHTLLALLMLLILLIFMGVACDPSKGDDCPAGYVRLDFTSPNYRCEVDRGGE